MKTQPHTFVLLAPLAIVISIYLLWSSGAEQKLPAPYETIVLGEEEREHHQQKLAWIESMHRTAPEDNWRRMDLDYRLKNQSKKQEKDELPVYGKWSELGSNNQAGRTVYTYYDEDEATVYTAADGGQIWKGGIGSDDWVSINDHLRIPAIRLIRKFEEPAFSRLLVHSAGWDIAGVLYSDDDGQNWTMASGFATATDWGFVRRIVIQPETKFVFAVSQEWDYTNWQAKSCIYKSIDLGESFEKIHTFSQPADYVDLWTAQTGDSPLYVLVQDEVFYLDEDDDLITLATLPDTQAGNTLLTGYYSPNGVKLYAMIRYDNLSHFFASGPGGEDWQETGTHNQGPFMVNSFSASPDQENKLYFGGIEAFFSSDAGASWTLVNGWGQYYGSPADKLHADIPSFNSFLDEAGEEMLFINTDGGTYISYDQMNSVENISLNNLRISQYYSSYTCRFDPSFTHAGSQDQGYQRSDEGMNGDVINYDQIISGDYGSMVSGDGGASIWMVYPGFAMYGPDINNTNALILENFVGSNYQWLPRLMEDPNDPDHVFLAGGRITSGTHIIKLERSGGNILYSELPFDFSNGTDATISALNYSKLDTDVWYVLTSENDFFYSDDEGETWTQTDAFSGPGSHYFYGASIAPANTSLNTVYVGGSGYSNPAVYRSSDGGASFIDFSEGLPNTLVFQLALSQDDSLLFAATEVGAFVCKTWEAQWYSLADSVVPDQAFWAVDYVDTLKVARFSTYGRGIWDFQLDPGVEADFAASATTIPSNTTADFTDLSMFGPDSWEWYFEGGIPEVSVEQHPAGILYPAAGSYDVRLIVSNNQSADTLLKEDYIHVGSVHVDNMEEVHGIKLYPNPASKSIVLESEQRFERMDVYSTSGRLLLSVRVSENGTDPVRLNISALQRGVYYLVTTSGVKQSVHTFIKR